MNDRFKFRVWLAGETCVDHKHPDQAYINCATGEAVYYNGFAGCMLDLDKYVIEQCTGLKDKNGKLIYEGDIVISQTGSKATIVWRQGKMQIRGRFKGKRFSYDMQDSRGPLIEIIGNIHKNPELIHA